MTLAQFDLAVAIGEILDRRPDADSLDRLILDRVFALRSELLGGGNRRALFAAFDALLGLDGISLDSPVEQDSRPSRSASTPRGFQLRSLSLRNWKVFNRCAIDLPRHDP